MVYYVSGHLCANHTEHQFHRFLKVPLAKVLVVEDDLELAANVRRWLEFDKHVVETAHDGKQASEMLKFYKYDLVILDWGLPESSGIDVLREYRKSGGVSPVLFLTGKGTVEDKEMGFNTGADDYLTKPFDMRELSARCKAILRRPTVIVGDILEAGGLCIDVASHRVVRDGEPISVSQQEFALLEFLIRHQGQVFAPEAILDRVWKSTSDSTPAVVRSHIKSLRKKLDVEGRRSFIKNVHGVGYCFDNGS